MITNKEFFMTKSAAMISEVSDCDYFAKSHSDCDLVPKRENFHRDHTRVLLFLENFFSEKYPYHRVAFPSRASLHEESP